MRFHFRAFVICVTLNRSDRILECPDQKALSFQAVQALLNKCLPCIPVNDVEDKLFQYVLPSTRQLFNEVIYFFNLLNCFNISIYSHSMDPYRLHNLIDVEIVK
jgi:hypothetical protein